MGRALASIVVAALACAAAASSAGADVWSPGEQLTEHGALRPTPALTDSGGGIVAWQRTSDGSVASAENYRGVGYATRTGPGSPFGAARTLGSSNRYLLTAAAQGGRARVLAEEGNFFEAERTPVDSAGPLGGQLSSGTPLDHPWPYDVYTTAFDGRGNGLAAWEDGHGGILAAWLAAGETRFGPTRRLGSGSTPDVAIDALGHGVVTWGDRVPGADPAGSRVHVATCEGDSCGGDTVVSDAANPGRGAQILTNRRGDVALVWSDRSGDSGAVALRRGGRFGAPHRYDFSRMPYAGKRVLALGETGDVLFAWWTVADGETFVASGELGPSGRQIGPERVPGDPTQEFDAGLDADGNAVFFGVQDYGRRRTAWTSERVAGGGWLWGDPHVIGSLPHTAPWYYEQDPPALAFDAEGRGIAAWTFLPESALYVASYDGRALAGHVPRIAAAKIRVTRRGVRLRYRLTKRARVRVSVARGNHRRLRRALHGRRGRNRARLVRRLAPGRYVVKMTARTKHARSRTRRLSFRVR